MFTDCFTVHLTCNEHIAAVLKDRHVIGKTFFFKRRRLPYYVRRIHFLRNHTYTIKEKNQIIQTKITMY